MYYINLQLTEKGAKVYKIIINGKEELIRLVIGSNGFITTAYPFNH